MRRLGLLKPGQRRTLALALRDVALDIVKKKGEFRKIEGLSGKSLDVKVGPLQISYTTPFVGLHTPSSQGNYGIDIWDMRIGKVFSVWWEPFQIVNFRYGTWMNELLPGTVAVIKEESDK